MGLHPPSAGPLSTPSIAGVDVYRFLVGQDDWGDQVYRIYDLFIGCGGSAVFS